MNKIFMGIFILILPISLTGCIESKFDVKDPTTSLQATSAPTQKNTPPQATETKSGKVTEIRTDEVDQDSAEWYKVIAKPKLVVHSTPHFTEEKLGNIYYGSKVKVIEKIYKTDYSPGGLEGIWVKIQWKDGTGYAFDAFLDPRMDAEEKTIEATISGYECGDNCYLTVIDSEDRKITGLCIAPLCQKWNEVIEMPATYIGKKVRLIVGESEQFDGGGDTVMGIMEAFSNIELLD